MASRKRNDGWVGWLLLILLVAGWDASAALTGGQTMTDAWRDGLRKHPLVAVFLWLSGGVVVGHLFLPPNIWRRYDLIHYLGRLVPSR